MTFTIEGYNTYLYWTKMNRDSSDGEGIVVKQISEHKIRPVKTPTTLDIRPVKGAHIIPDCYADIVLIGRKRTGKSTALFKMMFECIGKDTIVVLFVGTILNDDSWIATLARLQSLGIKVISYDTTIAGTGKSKINHVTELLNTMRKGLNSENEDENEDQDQKGGCGTAQSEKKDCPCNEITPYMAGLGLSDYKTPTEPEVKVKAPERAPDMAKPVKGKYNYPKYMVVFDDMSDQLKNRSIDTLLKQNRHYKSKCIISTQYYHDLLPGQRKQMGVFIIFKGQPATKLKLIYDDADMHITFDLFSQIYHDATKEPYSFLYINKDGPDGHPVLRKRFEFEYNIPNNMTLDGAIGK